MMAPQTRQQGESGTESSRTMGTASNMPPAETQLQHRHHLAHRDAANAATQNMTLDARLKIGDETGSSMNMKQHAIGCMYSQTNVDSSQLSI